MGHVEEPIVEKMSLLRREFLLTLINKNLWIYFNFISTSNMKACTYFTLTQFPNPPNGKMTLLDCRSSYVNVMIVIVLI